MQLEYKKFASNQNRSIRTFIKLIFIRLFLVVFILGSLLGTYYYFFKKDELKAQIANKIGYYCRHFNFIVKDILFNEYDKTYCIDLKPSSYFQKFKNTPILLVDINEIKNNVEAIDCVSQATVHRILPDKIDIQVTTKQPSAFWQNKGVLTFIDFNGDIMRVRSTENLDKFIIVTGDNAPKAYSKLLNFINIDQEIYSRITSVSWVGNRRWNVKFDNETEILLPEENPELSWQKFIALYRSKEEFKEWHYKLIDFRVENKMYVK